MKNEIKQQKTKKKHIFVFHLTVYFENAITNSNTEVIWRKQNEQDQENARRCRVYKVLNSTKQKNMYKKKVQVSFANNITNQHKSKKK